MAHIVIMRGLPGSGKSTLVQTLREKLAAEHGVQSSVASADSFFEDSEGNYNFDPMKLGEAHEACYQSFFEFCDLMVWFRDRKNVEARDVLFVDNTNLQLFEVSPYIALAKKFKVMTHIVEMCPSENESWGLYSRLCYDRQTHGVSLETFRRMVDSIQQCPSFWPSPIVAWHNKVLGFEPAARTVSTLAGLV